MVLGSPADASATIPAQHMENLQRMLRVLQITPLTNALPAQALINIAPGTMVTPDSDGLVLEARPFLPLAYGAVLGLIYYRAIGPQSRSQWDDQVYKAIANSLRDSSAARRQLSDLVNRYAGGRDQSLLPVIQGLERFRQDRARTADFFASLQMARQSVFPSEQSLSDPKVVGRNPWCLGTAPEFRIAYAQVCGQPGTATPSFLGLDEVRKTWQQTVGQQFATIIQSKMTEYLSAFLEFSASFLKGAIREGLDMLLKIPVVDLLIDWIKEKVAEQQLESMRARYEEDMRRREFLMQLGWGIDPHPPRDTLDESVSSMRRQSVLSH